MSVLTRAPTAAVAASVAAAGLAALVVDALVDVPLREPAVVALAAASFHTVGVAVRVGDRRERLGSILASSVAVTATVALFPNTAADVLLLVAVGGAVLLALGYSLSSGRTETAK